MRIAVNADALSEPQSVTGRYLMQLIAALGTIDGVNEYLILSQRPIHERPATPSSFAWDEAAASGPSERLRRVNWEQITFPDAARRRDAKMLFIPYFAPPYRSSLPVIMTILDLVPFALPDYRPTTTWVYHQLLERATKRAAYVIAGSEFAKSEIIRLLDVPAERIITIANAPAPTFHPVSDMTRWRAVKARYGLGERFLMYSGGFDVRKNVPMLVGAFAAAAHRASDPTLQLLIAGDVTLLGSGPLYPDWRPLVHRFGATSRVISAEVAEEDLPVLYSMTSGYIYPSQYEGDGQHVLEALRCGAPIIVSDHPALQEAVGSAALTFPLAKLSDGTANAAMRALSNQIVRLVTTPNLRDEYRQRGLARVKQFSWAQTAAEMSALFAEVVGISQ